MIGAHRTILSAVALLKYVGSALVPRGWRVGLVATWCCAMSPPVSSHADCMHAVRASHALQAVVRAANFSAGLGPLFKPAVLGAAGAWEASLVKHGFTHL